MNPSLESFVFPSETPPFTELAMVLIVPFATKSGAVDEYSFFAIVVPNILVEWN